MTRNARISLALCILLIVVLGISSVWFFMRIESLQNEVNNLQSDNTNLQGWLDGNKTLLQTTIDERNQLQIWLDGNVTNYESQIHNLNSQINYLTGEIISLENEIESLNSKYDNYVANHQYSNSEYWDYVYNHHHTDDEYDEAMFFFYYVNTSEQKFGVYDLRDELYGLEWSEPYQEGVFDCSEMSACLEWYLENEGWNAIIVLGDAPFGGGYHAWLLVETSIGHYMPVESTTLEIVWWDDPYYDNYFIYDYARDTIQEAMTYYESEFDWWEILQVLFE